MKPSVRPPRSTQPSDGRQTVLVTGVCGRLGKRLVRALHRNVNVVGVDRRPFADKPKDVVHEQLDMRRKKLKDVFRNFKIDAVVHLGIMHDPRASAAEHHSWNVAGFSKLLDYVSQFSVPKLVVLSSANAYGPQPGNAQFLTEDSPLLGGQNFSDIRDLIEVDMLAQSFFWKVPSTETVVLRPVHIVGTVRNAASNFLRLSTIPTVMGFDPMVQIIHEDDVVQSIVHALAPNKRGVFNLAGTEPLPLSRLVALTGKPTVSIPYAIAAPVLRQMWNFRLTTFPAPELDHIRFVCMVDDRRSRDELDFHPKHEAKDCVASLSSGKW